MEWNDGRLDELSKRVAGIDRRMEAGFAEVNSRLDEVNSKFDALYRMLFQAAWGLVVGLLSLVGVLVGLVATKF